jgi:hypothetical protein
MWRDIDLLPRLGASALVARSNSLVASGIAGVAAPADLLTSA